MPENVNTSVLTIDDAPKTEEVDNRETMIKIDHVSMVFNMASEQLNNLKEYAIKLAKRELFFEGFKALDDISFEVKKGDVFGIMGTNGSGKSTLLKIVAGVLDPSEGTCEINGSIAPLIELGAGFDMDLTARENIYLNGALLGYSKKFIDENFDEIVSFAEVEKFLDMPLKNYSSGMVARIAFAIATVIVPEILIVDEVLSVGDFMFQKKCEDRINQLIEEHGVTVLIVSHSNEQIARLCNKAIWIEKGHTRLMGDAEEVCRVYGGLGGRTGSAEAEQRVFKALEKVAKQKETPGSYKVFDGDNFASINTKMIREGWGNEKVKTVALACDVSHVNTIVANALASAYGAPVLPVSPDTIPDTVEQYLYQVEPKKVLLFDCWGRAANAEELAKAFPWSPEVVVFGRGKESLDFSIEVYEFGKKEGFWREEVGVIDFDSNPASLVAAPYLYKEKCPIFVVNNESNDGCLTDYLDKVDFKKAIVFAGAKNSAVKKVIESFDKKVLVLEKGNVSETCRNITNYISDSFLRDSSAEKKFCLSALTIGQWPNLLACGCFGARANAPLLLSDGANLDSIAQSLDYVSNSNVDSLFFVAGSAGINVMERRLFCSEAFAR